MKHGDLYRQVVHSSTDAIVVLELDGSIRFANASAESLLGVSDLEGHHVDEFLDEQGRRQSAEHLARAAQGTFLDDEVDTMVVRADGAPVWVRLRQTGLTEGERIAGVVLRLTDNHETKQLLEAVYENQRQLVRAERIARSGSWTWHASGRTTYSEGLVDLYGEHVADLLAGDREPLLAITHPEHHRTLVTAIEQLLSGEEPHVHLEMRQRGRAGWMWVRLRAEGSYGPDGALVEISGTYQDVSRARDTEDQLQDLVTQSSLMRAVASAANEATSLEEVLQQVGSMVVLHDDWDRARAFVPAPDGDGLVPYLQTDTASVVAVPLERELDDERDADAVERAVAEKCYRLGRTVWDDEDRLTIAAPVKLGEQTLAVVAITSMPPLYRHDMIEQMVDQAAILISRVAEREAFARELAEARDRALQASQHKSDFLATMSHEIRTPLNGIIGLNELLGLTELSDRQRHYVSGVAVSSRTLLDLLNNILDFSKIEAGHLEVEAVDFSVRQVVAEVGDMLAEPARERGLDLLATCSPDVPGRSNGDPTRLKQVLLNLGSNALKFTAAGSVALRVTVVDAGVVRFEVTDTGLGITAEQRDHVFAPFAQADASTTRRFGGTGLGLAICREIVAAFGGEIGVESEVGVGSTFWFTVPLGAATTSEADVPTAPERRPRRADDAAADAGGRVLVVEDNLINQWVAQGYLESQGFDVVTADNGEIALALLAEQDFDLVLMDVQMPVLDGYATTRALRQREADDPTVHRGRRLPVVAMTAAAITDERERCLEAGMDDFVTKPVSLTALQAVLERWGSAPVAGRAVAAPAPDGPADPHLDAARLGELLDMGPGAEVYLERSITNFAARRAAVHAECTRAVAEGDGPALVAAAHSLRGSAGTLGVPVVSRLAGELEALGDGGDLDAARALLGDLATALDDAAAALEAYLADVRPSSAPS